tara:strand:- start:1749 stop:2471 length:723 start_codon:yes stop_codon:yes gene_type:complete
MVNKSSSYPKMKTRKRELHAPHKPPYIIMKIVIKSIFLLILNFSCFSQNSGKEKLNLVFYDKCTNSFIKPHIEIDTIPGLKNGKSISYYINRGNWVSQSFSSTIINKKIDTILIPKILFSIGNKLHSKRWSYLNCLKVCNGIESDYYVNGNKRLEGKFKNGKPIELKEFRENGKLFSQSFYENLTLNFKRINYFDSNGKLSEYEIYKNRKKKTIIKTFNKNNKLVSQKTEKYHIEKTKWN